MSMRVGKDWMKAEDINHAIIKKRKYIKQIESAPFLTCKIAVDASVPIIAAKCGNAGACH